MTRLSDKKQINKQLQREPMSKIEQKGKMKKDKE
jgi:hypothetical protein